MGPSTAPLTLATALLAGFLAGCTPDAHAPRAGWDGTVDTLAAGRIVVRNGGEPLWAEGEAWRLTEAVRVGVAEGDGPDVFGQIRAVELDPEGRMYVLDAQASEVRIFTADGFHVRTVGRPGEGPGELGGPAGLAWGPDGALWVMDFRNARYTAFDPETGEVVAERRRPFGFFALPWPGGFDREGRLWDTGLARVEGTPGLMSLVRLDSAFLPMDTVRAPRQDESASILFTRGDGTLVMSMPDPYAPRPVWALWSRGGIIASDGVEYVLHLEAPGGDTVRTIALDRPRPAVSRTERDSVTTAFRETAAELAGDASPVRDPRVPDTKPALRAVFEDDRNHLWVQPYRTEGEPAAWDVFDPEGRYLGAVEMPVAIPPGVRPV
ncbi:MAG TPA: 6-bladed beta-propeller, partial [Longimicrobiales bacterium]|nr:6-bladed beta-propeller [Longimicrobiales bacterium]